MDGPHIASLLLQVLPDARDALVTALAREPGVELAAVGEGKLVMVEEHADEGALTARMRALADRPGVLSVSLVYHHHETAEALAEEIVDAADPT